MATVEFAFGLVMASRGFQWGDAFARSSAALAVLHGADPKLSDIGFVWMPLPTFLNLPWVAFYPFVPGIVSSGASAALTSAVAGGATAALLLVTSRRLGLPRRVGWVFALLVCANPMLFLYGSSGMAEGIAAPFLVGSVCFVTLFWHTGERLWIAAAGVALALGFASMYEAAPFGIALFLAVAGGVLWSTEARPAMPLGPRRAVEGLGLLLVVPSVFVAVVWVGANAVIMKDPLFFVNGAYGYTSFRSGPYIATGPVVRHDVLGVLGLVGPRIAPFLIPLAAVLLVRLLDRRLWRVQSLAAVLLALSVPGLLVAPMAYSGSQMASLRYYMFPLFVGAAFGLYEIARSHLRSRAGMIVLGSWIVAAPACLAAMFAPSLGVQEHRELRAVVHGQENLEAGYYDPVRSRTALARSLDATVLARGERVMLDAFQGAGIAAQVRPDAMRRLLIVTSDRRFKPALSDPARFTIRYVLVPDPKSWPQDAILRARPRLWSGREPGFTLVRRFPAAGEQPDNWALFRVGPGVPRLETGGGAG